MSQKQDRLILIEKMRCKKRKEKSNNTKENKQKANKTRKEKKQKKNGCHALNRKQKKKELEPLCACLGPPLTRGQKAHHGHYVVNNA